jgi:hypothetical protein
MYKRVMILDFQLTDGLVGQVARQKHGAIWA